MASKIHTRRSDANRRSQQRAWYMARRMDVVNDLQGRIEASKSSKILYDRDSGSGEIPANLAKYVRGPERRFLAKPATEPPEPATP